MMRYWKHFLQERMKDMDAKHILYASMDHPTLQRISILDIVDRYRGMNGIGRMEDVVVFLDEVHLHEGFERELKVLHDLGHTKIYASGSASIFILEKGAFLTGRQHFIEVNPFDLEEHLELLDIRADPWNSSLMVKYAEDMVLLGGLPEYIRDRDPGYVTELVDSIIYKDVVSRHSVSNAMLLKDLILLLSQSIGNRVSARKIGRVLGMTHQTVMEYISHFIEVKLVHIVEREGKVSVRKASPRKIYFVDTGMVHVLSPTVNLGALVENVVFNNLRRSGEPRYLVHKGKEIDFVMGDTAIEVKYKDHIGKEEINHLSSLRGYREKIVISRSFKGKIGNIKVLPLYKFLSEGI